MTSEAATLPLGGRYDLLRSTGPLLLASSLLLLAIFHTEAAAAVRVWRNSTAFGHCFLVLPVAAWLAWERRGAAIGQAPRPVPWLALAAIPLGLVWFTAARLGVMEGRQLAAMAMLQLLVLCVLGWRLWRSFAVPLLYLFFLVPFGEFLVRPLQAFTAGFIDVGLDVVGVPHVVTQFVIEIPEGAFRVEEACAGLRFLIAAIAFGVVYACMLYRSPGRRTAFIAASMTVPVLANGVRALGIVLLGHVRGSAEAGAVDHLVYGWVFFSLVIVLLILLGLPFREDLRRSAGAARPVGPRLAGPIDPTAVSRMVAAAAVVLALAGMASLASAMHGGRAAGVQHAAAVGAGGAAD